jgi:hypothetical protein
MSEAMKGSGGQPERPGCVSAYAILLWISSALGLIGLFCLISGLAPIFEGGLGLIELLLAGVGLVVLAVYVITGIGLWQMKKWGWALVVVMQGASLILGLLSMLLAILTLAASGGDFAASQPAALLSTFASALVNVFILYWFIKNRALFDGAPAYKKVIGADGEEIVVPAQSKGNDATMLLAAGGGLVLVLILICLGVVFVLAVAGPQIGNVFSQITYELENPTTGHWTGVWPALRLLMA